MPSTPPAARTGSCGEGILAATHTATQLLQDGSEYVAVVAFAWFAIRLKDKLVAWLITRQSLRT
jgi:hypothetical protein